jgi:hypothetical protein
MYREHELLRTPPDATKLWRYLDLSHFLWFLSQQALYFANLIEFDDRWEGAIPAGTSEGLKRAYLSAVRSYGTALGADPLNEELDPEMLQKFKSSLMSRQAIYGVNCWHQNEVESVAMWKLYTQGKDGVTIQTTVARLKDCLSREPRTIFIAKVNYFDHETLPEEGLISHDTLIPIVVKRRSFGHESEVRLIMDRQRDIHPVAAYNSGAVVADEDEFGPSKGETVPISLSNLVERIVASPDFPSWAMASLQERVTTAGLEVTVEKSDLLRLPEVIKIPYIGRAN